MFWGGAGVLEGLCLLMVYDFIAAESAASHKIARNVGIDDHAQHNPKDLRVSCVKKSR